MTRFLQVAAVTALAWLGAACTDRTPQREGAAVTSSSSSSALSVAGRGTPFGVLPSGDTVHRYTLRNGDVTMRVLDYGGIVQSLEVPDAAGRRADVVLGYDDLTGYLRSSPYFGALIGRYGNRIAGGRFTLDGTTYTLATNNGPNALHGGVTGFDKVRWQVLHATDSSLVLRHVSRDGEEGYPGTLVATVTYTLTPDNRWVIDYEATTDKATPVNLTQHTYWNLSGEGSTPVLQHTLQLMADAFTAVDTTLIPTGVLQAVAGTPLDFRTPQPIGARIDENSAQLRFGGGYDHNFVLSGAPDATGLRQAAVVHDPGTGRTLTMFTTEPGVQFYSGNFLDGTIVGKGRTTYGHRSGFCLEAQHFPDSPNQPAFPSTILRPGERLASRTVYAFGANTRRP